jgi:hypothetical protein
LRTLFVVVTVFACWLGWNVNFIQRRKAALSAIHERQKGIPELEGWSNVRVAFDSVQEMNSHPPHIAKIRAWLGDKPVPFVTVLFKADADAVRPLFPEATILYVKNPWMAHWLVERSDHRQSSTH